MVFDANFTCESIIAKFGVKTGDRLRPQTCPLTDDGIVHVSICYKKTQTRSAQEIEEHKRITLSIDSREEAQHTTGKPNEARRDVSDEWRFSFPAIAIAIKRHKCEEGFNPSATLCYIRRFSK